MNSNRLAALGLPFVPRSPDYVLKKAQLLRKHFPQLTPGRAREATARALGYPDHFAYEKSRESGAPPSPADDKVPPAVAQKRLLIQRQALTDFLDLSAEQVEAFLPRWNLTGASKVDPALAGVPPKEFNALLELARYCARTPSAWEAPEVDQHYAIYCAFSEQDSRLDRALENTLWCDTEVRQSIFAWMSRQLGSAVHQSGNRSTQTWVVGFVVKDPVGLVSLSPLPDDAHLNIKTFFENRLPGDFQVRVSQRMVCAPAEAGVSLSTAKFAAALQDTEGRTPAEFPETSRILQTCESCKLLVGLEFSAPRTPPVFTRTMRAMRRTLENLDQLSGLEINVPFLNYRNASQAILLTPEHALAWTQAAVWEDPFEISHVFAMARADADFPVEVVRRATYKDETGRQRSEIHLYFGDKVRLLSTGFTGTSASFQVGHYVLKEAENQQLPCNMFDDQEDSPWHDATESLSDRIVRSLYFYPHEITSKLELLRDWGFFTAQNPKLEYTAFHLRLASDLEVAQSYANFIANQLSFSPLKHHSVGCFIVRGLVDSDAALRRLPENTLSAIKTFMRTALSLESTAIPLDVSPLVVCGLEDAPFRYPELLAFAAKRGLDATVLSKDLRHYHTSKLERPARGFTVFFVSTNFERATHSPHKKGFPSLPWIKDTPQYEAIVHEPLDWIIEQTVPMELSSELVWCLSGEDPASMTLHVSDTPPRYEGYQGAAVVTTVWPEGTQETMTFPSTCIGLTVGELANRVAQVNKPLLDEKRPK